MNLGRRLCRTSAMRMGTGLESGQRWAILIANVPGFDSFHASRAPFAPPPDYWTGPEQVISPSSDDPQSPQ